jgi:hypothetical protein
MVGIETETRWGTRVLRSAFISASYLLCDISELTLIHHCVPFSFIFPSHPNPHLGVMDSFESLETGMKAFSSKMCVCTQQICIKVQGFHGFWKLCVLQLNVIEWECFRKDMGATKHAMCTWLEHHSVMIR